MGIFETCGRIWVLPHSVVDNSDFTPSCLTALVTLLILAAQGSFSCFPFETARILMAIHVFVFLLVVCLLLSLARLGHLDWFHCRPSSSRGGATRTPVQRLRHRPAAQTIAPPVASPAPTRLLWDLLLRLCAPGARSKAGGERQRQGGRSPLEGQRRQNPPLYPCLRRRRVVRQREQPEEP
jgi:hypothetical protein